jgi:hydroxyethylthiazole kinase
LKLISTTWQKACGRIERRCSYYGAEDVVSNGQDIYSIKNGTNIMGRIVGTGCMAASVIGTFCAVG